MLSWLFGTRNGRLGDDLEQEIERRRQHAHRSGVVDAFLHLYFESWRYLPSWTRSPRNAKWCHPWITEANEDDKHKRVDLKVRGRQYVIAVDGKPSYVDDFDDDMAFELLIDGALALGLRVHVKQNEYAETWHSPYVTAFVAGPWVSEVLQLAKETKELHERNMKACNSETAQKQAHRFGL